MAKRPRHHELDLTTLMEGDDAPEVSALSAELKTVTQALATTRFGDPDAFAFDSDKADEDAVSALREKMQGLKVVSRAKVTQDRVYSAAYHPDITKDLIFFGGEFLLHSLKTTD